MLPGARMLFASGKWKNPYVTDGLVAMWDGEWNAGPGVHDAAVTTWVDLSGNSNDATLYNVTFSNNYATFDGSSSYGNAPNEALTFDTITVETVYQLTATKNHILLYNYASGGIARCVGPSNILSVYIGSLGTNGPRILPLANMNLIASRSFTFNKTGFVSGLENTLPMTISGSENYGVFGTGVKIGRRDNGVYFGGHVYTIRAYNRALTAAEVAANYAIDQRRFNIS